MRRKRLQHSADILCRMFCGWELMNSYPRLVELGSGTLTIDGLTGSCRFEGDPIESIAIAGALHGWLCEDLAKHHIKRADLLKAELVAKLDFSSVSAGARVTRDHHMDRSGRPIDSGLFHRLGIECLSTVQTDEATYVSEYRDVEEFPHNWPAP